jgi:hypothetical protein
MYMNWSSFSDRHNQLGLPFPEQAFDLAEFKRRIGRSSARRQVRQRSERSLHSL